MSNIRQIMQEENATDIERLINESMANEPSLEKFDAIREWVRIAYETELIDKTQKWVLIDMVRDCETRIKLKEVSA